VEETSVEVSVVDLAHLEAILNNSHSRITLEEHHCSDKHNHKEETSLADKILLIQVLLVSLLKAAHFLEGITTLLLMVNSHLPLVPEAFSNHLSLSPSLGRQLNLIMVLEIHLV
jgi:hypothetical protein